MVEIISRRVGLRQPLETFCSLLKESVVVFYFMSTSPHDYGFALAVKPGSLQGWVHTNSDTVTKNTVFTIHFQWDPLWALVRHLKLSLAQLCGRCSQCHAVASNHEPPWSDTNATQRTTRLDVIRWVLLIMWDSPRTTVLDFKAVHNLVWMQPR